MRRLWAWAAAGAWTTAATAVEPLPVLRSAWHDEVDPTQLGVTIALLVCSAALIAVAGAGLWLRRQVPLWLVLLSMVFPVVWVTGFTAWISAHHRMRESIQDETEGFALTAAGHAALSVHKAIAAGPLMNDLWANAYYTALHSTNDSYPTPFRRLNALRKSFQDYGAGVEIVYWGNEDGYSFGVDRTGGDGGHVMYYIFPQSIRSSSSPLTSVFTCPERDTAGMECSGAACDGGAADAQCAGSCGLVSTAACLGDDPAGGPRLGMFPAPRWNSVIPSAPSLHNSYMDARNQTPYLIGAQGHAWTEPYFFGDTSDEGGGSVNSKIGFTASLTVNAPELLPQIHPVGVISTDFTIASLMPILKPLVPTNKSQLVLANYDGQVLSGTMAQSDLLFNGREVPTVWSATPRVRGPFDVVVRRYGSLHEAKGQIALLHGKVEGEWCLVLSQPVAISNLELLLVLSIPYTDVLKVSTDASARGSVLLFLVSMLMCALMGLIISTAVAPLDALGAQMEGASKLRAMKRGDTMRSYVQEVRVLQDACDMMCEQLLCAKPYLPQHILLQLKQEDEAALVKDAPPQSPRTPPLSPRRIEDLDPVQPRRASVAHRRRRSQRRSQAHLARRSSLRVARIGVAAFGNWLETRCVGMLSLNLRHFHATTARCNIRNYSTFVHKYWSKVLEEVGRVGGIAEHVMGDRCLASFNASQRARHPGQAAALAALRIRRDLRQLRLGVDSLTAGAAVGRATIGNLGCIGLKRFNVIGPVVSQCVVLERLSRWYVSQGGALASVVTTADVCEEEGDLVTLPMDVLSLPFATAPGVLHVVIGERGEGADPAPPQPPITPEAIFAHLTHGRRSEAAAAISKYAAHLQHAPDDRAFLKQAMLKNMRALAAQDTDQPTSDLGAYYDLCVLGRTG